MQITAQKTEDPVDRLELEHKVKDMYRRAIESAGLNVALVCLNPQYGFLTESAAGASDTWGVKSISLVAVKQ